MRRILPNTFDVIVLSIVIITAIVAGLVGYHRLQSDHICAIPGPTWLWTIIGIASVMYGMWVSTQPGNIQTYTICLVYTVARMAVVVTMIVGGLGIILRPPRALPYLVSMYIGIGIICAGGWMYWKYSSPFWISNEEDSPQ